MTQRQQGNPESEHACDSELVNQAGDERSQASGVLILAAQDVVVGKEGLRAQRLAGRKQQREACEMVDGTQQ